MGRKVSDAELKRQITREGKHWGLVPMLSVFGDVLVAEEIPCVVPLASGLLVLDRVQRDITSVSMDYPFASILRNRKHKAERTASLRSEITRQIDEKLAEQRLAEIYKELHEDLKRANKQKVMRYGNVTVRG